MATFEYRMESTGEKVLLPTPALSYTQVDMYLRCPKQFYHRYVEGYKEPPGVALMEGSATHKALEIQNLHRIQQGENLPAKKVIECFQDDFATRVMEVEDWSDGEDVDEIHARATKYLTHYMEVLAPEIEPITAEQVFQTKFDGIPLQGALDLTTFKTAWDYKTVSSRSKKLQRGAVDHDLQLTIYSKVAQKRVVGFIALVKDKGEARKLSAVRHPTDWQYAEEVIRGVARAITAGAFPMTAPDNWACSNRFCGYWHRCRGAIMQGTFPNPAPGGKKLYRTADLPPTRTQLATQAAESAEERDE